MHTLYCLPEQSRQFPIKEPLMLSKGKVPSDCVHLSQLRWNHCKEGGPPELPFTMTLWSNVMDARHCWSAAQKNKRRYSMRFTGSCSSVYSQLSCLFCLLSNVAGTPHNGSSLATLGKLVANIVDACSPINPARSLIATLRKDSEVLLEITEDFVKIRKSLHLVSFFEMEMTTIAPFIRKLASVLRIVQSLISNWATR